VTFRLADSLPVEKLEQMRVERDEWLMAHRGRAALGASNKDCSPFSDATRASRPQTMMRGAALRLRDEMLAELSAADRTEYHELFSKRFQDGLDAGHGSCILRDERMCAIVEDKLRHFVDLRYSLYAFVVMPNHVHVLFMPEEGFDSRTIVAGWKSCAAHDINRIFKRTGTLWQKESYDHLVRNVEEFNRIRAYIRGNDPRLAFDVYKDELPLFSHGVPSASTIAVHGVVSPVDAMPSSRIIGPDRPFSEHGGVSASTTAIDRADSAAGVVQARHCRCAALGASNDDCPSFPMTRRGAASTGGATSTGGIASTGVRAIVSLGSNIEPRAEYLKQALAALSALPETHFVKASSVIETEPVDVPAEFASQKFRNQVAVFETGLEPMDFSRRMHAIEDDLGRVRTVRNGPRTIDIDLIDFGGIVLNTSELTLPHPRAHARDFVVNPLRELGISVSRALCGAGG